MTNHLLTFMKHNLVRALRRVARAAAVACLVSSSTAGAQQATPFDFSIRNIMRGPELYGRPPQDVRWSADNRWIYFTWVEPGKDWREQRAQFRVRAVAGARPERVSIQQVDSAGPQFAQGDRSHNGRFAAVEFNGDLFVNDLTMGTTRRLTQTVAAERDPKFSARDDQVFFVRDNNVFSIGLSTGFLRQLTDIHTCPALADSARLRQQLRSASTGLPEAVADLGTCRPADSVKAEGQRGRLEQQQRDLFESVRDRIRADSIARAERRTRASLGLTPLYLQPGEEVARFSVSPTGTAVLVTTRTPAPGTRATEVPQYVTHSGYAEDLRVRTKVGDVPEKGRIALLPLPGGSAKWLKPFVVAADTASGFFALRGWNDTGTRALIQAYSGDNKTRLTQTVDPSGALTTVETLRDSAWVGGPCQSCSGWYDSGRRIWFASEADGFSHIYSVAADGSGKRQLTTGRWEVRDAQLSADEQVLYLTTNEVSPFEEHLYRMSVGGGAREKITNRQGKHDAVVSDDGKLIADVYSYVNRPPELFLLRNQAGAEMSQLTTSPTAEWLSFPWIVPELVMIPGSDGVQVPAHIYRPSDMKAQSNGAGVIFVHGAGYLHNVGHFWKVSYPREYMFNQLLASKGYTVLDLDFRGSDGYGRDWRTAIYRFMGGRDLQDHVDASRYLHRNFGIDPERIGIYGGSYGGFIALMALFTEQQHFGAGAALRSVTDWAHYNQGYTSNILNLPHTDTLAYRRSSPIYFAEGLQDPLLMAHGMVDVNVHFQDIVRLTQRLIELGKTRWELAVYPVEDHAFVRPSSWTDEYRRIFELFERYLPAGATGR